MQRSFLEGKITKRKNKTLKLLYYIIKIIQGGVEKIDLTYFKLRFILLI